MLTANPEQENFDGDRAGEACDANDTDPSVGKDSFNKHTEPKIISPIPIAIT